MSVFQRQRLLRADGLNEAACRHLLGCLVVPRPIAWISTRSTSGVANLAPFSSFTILAADPPLVGVSIAHGSHGPKDTLVNVRATGSFCVNMVIEPLLEAMRLSSGCHAPDVDEFQIADLVSCPAAEVVAPFVEQASAVLECRLFREVALSPASAVLLVGEVVAFRVPPRLDETQPHPAGGLAAVVPVGHLNERSYTLIRDAVSLRLRHLVRGRNHELEP